MRIQIIKNIVLGAVIIFVMAMDARFSLAQNQSNHSMSQVLEFSLVNLKKSAQDIWSKNEWLVAENQKLKETVEDLKLELRGLQQRKADLSENKMRIETLLEDESKELSRALEGRQRLVGDVRQLTQEQTRLMARQRHQEIQDIDVKNEIRYLQNDIVALKQKLDNLNVQIETKPPRSNQQAYRTKINETEDKIADLRGEIDKYKQRYNKEFKEIDRLKEQQIALKQQLNIEKDQLALVLEQEKTLKQELTKVKESKDQELEALGASVEHLESQNKDLKQTLTMARTKIMEKKINLATNQKETESVAENLRIMEIENKSLRRELSQLTSRMDDNIQ